MVVFRYLKSWFVRTAFCERCQEFLDQVKIFKPLLHKKQRKAIKPVFKKIVEQEKKASMLYFGIRGSLIVGIIVLLSVAIDFGPVRLLIGIATAVVIPALTLWELREYYHEATVKVKKSIAAKKKAAQKSAASTASAAANAPSQSGLVPRRRSLHS